MTRRLAVLFAAGALGSCVAGPLEHSNYFDPYGSNTLTILGAPDTMFAVDQEFTLTAVARDGFPALGGAAGPTWQIIGGNALVLQVGDGVFRVSGLASLLPAVVTIRAHVPPYNLNPVDTARVWIRQRPVSMDLACTPTPACLSLSAAGATKMLFFSALDANGHLVSLPSGAYRWGTVVSRAPTIVQVFDRPTGGSIELKGLLAGTAWIVMTADGLADSVQVTVLP